MLSKGKPKYLQPAAYSQRKSTFIDRQFQLKYTRYILGMATVSALIFLAPTLYFINQNYSIFMQLTDELSPGLAAYIAREQFSFNLTFSVLFIANFVFWAVFSNKMTAKIAGPAKILRNHIRLLSRGDFTLAPVHLRDDDEFKELVNTYNYFYTLLKVQNERELHELKKVREAMSNPVAKELITNLIQEREQRAS